MDYQQSIKNLNHLKNFVRAWAECRIFFFFYSEAEFKNEIYDGKRTSTQQKVIDQNLHSKFPYGFISNDKSGKEMLYYRDENITVQYDLFSQEFDVFGCHDPDDPVDKEQLRSQFLLLTELLKNK